MNLLTEEEIRELTGAQKVSKQKEVLERNGIRYITRLDKSIVTTWHYVNHPYAGAIVSNDAEPDYSSLAG